MNWPRVTLVRGSENDAPSILAPSIGAWVGEKTETYVPLVDLQRAELAWKERRRECGELEQKLRATNERLNGVARAGLNEQPDYVAHWDGKPTPEDRAALDEIVKAAWEKMADEPLWLHALKLAQAALAKPGTGEQIRLKAVEAIRAALDQPVEDDA